MQTLCFDEPIVVWLELGRQDRGVRRIRDVHDGLAALHRYGIETLKREGRPCREWRRAAALLVRARSQPSTDRIRRARAALAEAATMVGALAVPDPLGVLAERGYAFAP